MKIRFIYTVIVLLFISCSNGQKSNFNEKGKDLNLQYEVLSKNSPFPNDNITIYSGFLIIDIPKGTRYIDIAESIKNIGIKENLALAKIFISKTGYLMEIDSIPRDYPKYIKSFLCHYDLTSKGLNWKYLFNINDIQFKGDLPLRINMK
ncbi:MAG: hypothetical protein K8R58_03595 [Bacteroidales bacterium]|nr:hypothetical protein [Bacteroidales bacterium]